MAVSGSKFLQPRLALPEWVHKGEAMVVGSLQSHTPDGPDSYRDAAWGLVDPSPTAPEVAEEVELLN